MERINASFILILIQCWELHNVSRRKDKIRVHKSFAVRNVSSTKWEHVYLRYENIPAKIKRERERERERGGERGKKETNYVQIGIYKCYHQKVCL